MNAREYKNLVMQFGGMCYGNTIQSKFIKKVNERAQKSGGFLSSIENVFFNKKSSAPLNPDGICNGLIQIFYQKIMENLDRTKAIMQFSKRLDMFDQGLADQAAHFQSIGESYSNVGENFFYKTLGLDLEETTKYNPYDNEKALKRTEEIQEKIKKMGLKPSKMEKTNSDDVLQRLVEDAIHHSENSLIRILFAFNKDERTYFNELSNAHVISFFKVRDTNNKILFVFYDPNGLPTFFDDEIKLAKFMKYYLNNVALDLKKQINADTITINLNRYTNNQSFHDTMHALVKRIDEKIILLEGEQQNKEFLHQLQLLKKKCILADTKSMYYIEPQKIENDNTVFSMEFSQYRQKNSEGHAKPFLSNNDVIAFIKNDIHALNEINGAFSAELLDILENKVSPVITTNRKV